MSKIYKIDADFSNGLKTNQFHTEIENSSITANIIGVHTVGANVTIEFDQTLSGGEQTMLNTVISNHIPNNSKPKTKFFILTPKTKITSTNWQSVISFKYPGSDVSGDIDYIEIMSYIDTSITNYDIRVINSNNGAIIVQKLANTNKDLEAIDLGTISNVPAGPSILELHAKRTGGGTNKYVYIDNILIYNNN